MLIVADGQDVSDLIPAVPGNQIRLLQLEQGDPDPVTIGDKRNIGCKHAHGSIICIFDDDDYSGPRRIQNQVIRLVTSGKALTGYHTMMFHGPGKEERWLYTGAPDYAVGTSFCFRKEWWEVYPFLGLHVGEDNAMCYAARDAGQLIAVPGGDLMIANTHAGNTSPRTFDGAWKQLL